MVDCGVSFNKIKEYLYGIKYLLLTHIHSDHIKPSTLDQIKKMYPTIVIIGNYEVHQTYKVDRIANAGYLLETDDYDLMPFECVHDVVTYGFTWTYEYQTVIYATDTSSMKYAPKGQYDYIFIESNHSEKKLEMVANQPTRGYNPYLSGKRHLSTEQAKAFYYTNRRNKDSHFIELHKSSRFF